MAVDNCKPMLILTKVVKGGVTYQASNVAPVQKSSYFAFSSPRIEFL
jgi:hypothetical protein